MTQEVISLAIDGDGDKPEELLVERIGPNTYRLLVSPGLVLGLAAGDVLRLLPGRSAGRSYDLVARGGNVCVQLWSDGGIEAAEPMFTAMLRDIGGRLDGHIAGDLLVYTIPIASGFAAIEAVMKAATERHPGVQWYYGNVYDPKDGVTPLDWWIGANAAGR